MKNLVFKWRSGSSAIVTNEKLHMSTAVKAYSISKKRIKLNRPIPTVMLSFFVLLFLFAGKAEPAFYKVYALFVLNFVKHTEWSTKSSVLTIGVAGSKELEDEFLKIAKTRGSSAQQMVVHNTEDETVLAQCQIIFIPANKSSIVSKLITDFSNKEILVVTEEADFIKKGAAFSFKIVDSKIRFQVNEKVINSHGLKISSALLSMADK